jgi:uracil-DNA glycosylase family 4
MDVFQSFSTEARFKDLCQAVRYCTICPRLKDRDKILSEANGDLSTKVIFIAEAPGRLGADVTGIPLSGDQTGENFEALLGKTGWCREDVFITNAILCNPRAEDGNNSTPTPKEIANCMSYLEMTIELVQPEVVVTLGRVALEALKGLHPHSYVLREHVGRPLPWAGKILMPLYHPGPRARVYRSLSKQTADFLELANIVDPKEGILEKRLREVGCQRRINQNGFHEFQKLAHIIVQSLGRMTYFKLTKLLYLTDLHALESLGRSLTGEIYLRQQDGPWPPVLREMIEPLEGREIHFSFRGRVPRVEPGPSPRIELDYTNNELEVIVDVLNRYGNLTNAGIKMAAYRTRPMRYVREQEKLGRNMYNLPVIYKDKTALELVG